MGRTCKPNPVVDDIAVVAMLSMYMAGENYPAICASTGWSQITVIKHIDRFRYDAGVMKVLDVARARMFIKAHGVTA